MDVVKIRPATKEDAQSVMQLVQMLAEFLKDPVPKEQNVLHNLFEETKYTRCSTIVAEVLSGPEGSESTVLSSAKIIGYAMYYYGYSVLEGPFLYIEDIFVKDEMRGSGVGAALMKECAKIAVANDCSRLTWMAENWNTAALKFYEKRIGAPCQKERLTYSLFGESFTSFYNANSQGVMDKVKIRPATREDVPTIVYLTQLLAEYLKEPLAPKLGEKEVLSNCFGEVKYAQAIVAELLSDPEDSEDAVPNELPSSRMSRNKRIIGHAVYYYRFTTAYERLLYIEDVFVKPEMRSKGIGTALFKECAKIAAANGCSAVKWQVLDWCSDTIQFYEQRIGATLTKGALTFSMKQKEFAAFAREGDKHT